MTYRSLLSAVAVGVICTWPSAFNSMVVNQMYDLLKKFLAKNLNVGSAFLWSFFVSGHILFVLLGNLSSSYLLDNFGRKRMLQVMAFPAMLALILETVSYNFEQPLLLFLGRFLLGYVSGIHLVVAAVFLSETSTKGVRGRRTAYTPVCNAVAYLVAAVLCVESLMGNGEIWNYMFLVPLLATLIGVFVLCRCPESPVFLKCVQSDNQAAVESQKFYYPTPIDGTDSSTIGELEMELQQSIAEQEFHTKTSFCSRVKCLIKDRRLRVSLVVAMTMAVNFSTSSFVLLSSYSTAILKSLGVSNELAKRFTICLAASTLLAVFSAKYLIDKLGRRPLVLIGTFASSLLLICIGILCQLGQAHTSTALQWSVAVFIVLCSFSGRCGVFAVFGVIIPEIFPFRTRTTGRALTGILNDFLGFLVLFCFYPLYQISPVFSFAIVAFPTFGCGVVLWFFCPETKDRGVEYILAEINQEIDYWQFSADSEEIDDGKEEINEKTPLNKNF